MKNILFITAFIALLCTKASAQYISIDFGNHPLGACTATVSVSLVLIDVTACPTATPFSVGVGTVAAFWTQPFALGAGPLASYSPSVYNIIGVEVNGSPAVGMPNDPCGNPTGFPGSLPWTPTPPACPGNIWWDPLAGIPNAIAFYN